MLETALRGVEVVERQATDRRITIVTDPDRDPGTRLIPADIEVAGSVVAEGPMVVGSARRTAVADPAPAPQQQPAVRGRPAERVIDALERAIPTHGEGATRVDHRPPQRADRLLGAGRRIDDDTERIRRSGGGFGGPAHDRPIA